MEATRHVARIRTRVDLIFRRGRVMLHDRFSSGLRLAFFRAGPYQVVEVEVCRDNGVSFQRRAFRFNARQFTARVVGIRRLPLGARGTWLEFLCQRAQISRRSLILSQGSLNADSGDAREDDREANDERAYPQEGVGVSGNFRRA